MWLGFLTVSKCIFYYSYDIVIFQVSLCLIPRVPIKTLLTLIPQFCKSGLLKMNSPQYKALLERLSSEEVLNDLSTDPLESFLAIRRWQLSNRILPGKSMMRQNTPAIDDALQNLHLASFKVCICYTFEIFEIKLINVILSFLFQNILW